MDTKNNLSFRTDRCKKFNSLGDNKYNYKQEGILKHCLPKILFKGNTILVTFIQLIDLRLILLTNYIDKLKHFKHVTWY